MTAHLDKIEDKIRTMVEELDLAIVFHELWKPTALDENLHNRLGNSNAAKAFEVVRSALRREMLMALMRLWDENGLQLVCVISQLQDENLINEIAKKRATWSASRRQSRAPSLIVGAWKRR